MLFASIPERKTMQLLASEDSQTIRKIGINVAALLLVTVVLLTVSQLLV
jgi:hypothetical protein